MGDWQPIETAADDGRFIIVFDPRQEVTVYVRPAEGAWWRYHGMRPGAWMPLPAPPQDKP